MKLVAGLALAAPVVLASPAFAALVVSKGASSNVTCIGGTCTATAADAVLNVRDLRHLLASGDVTVASGSAAMDIVFDAKLQWTKPGRLTLDSWRGIAIDLDITSEGPGGVTLTTNDGGSGGDLVFSGKGKVSFWSTSNSLIINGTAYTLVSSVKVLAEQVSSNPNGAYALSKYYDASADRVYGGSPVKVAFGGTFEGLGHVIDNLQVKTDRESQVGFFANVASGGTVRDVTFEHAALTGNDSLVGFAAGTNAGTISHVVADAAIDLNHGGHGGGLVGDNTGTISWCGFSGSIVSEDDRNGFGGLDGSNEGTIVHSYSTASVSGHDVAGLVFGNGGSILLSYATGAVSADYSGRVAANAGGLVVGNAGTIDQSYAMGPVNSFRGARHARDLTSANGDIGGIVIYNTGSITNTYALSPIDAGLRTASGGFEFATSSPGTVASSYAAGAVMRGGHQGNYGFAGYSTIGTNDYWDIDTTGTSDGCLHDCNGVTGLTNAQFQAGLPAGFDPAIWTQSAGVNNGLPYLIANPPM